MFEIWLCSLQAAVSKTSRMMGEEQARLVAIWDSICVGWLLLTVKASFLLH